MKAINDIIKFIVEDQQRDIKSFKVDLLALCFEKNRERAEYIKNEVKY